MEEETTSPDKTRRAVLTSPPSPRQSISYRPSEEEAMSSTRNEEHYQAVNNLTSSSSVWPSFSTSSLSSFTTVSTSFNTPIDDEMDSDFKPPPQAIVSRTVTPKLMSRSSQPFRRPAPPLFEQILDYQDTLFEICSWLPAKDLINLYAVSRRFHRIINQQITTLILRNAQTRMPESAEVFHFKGYKSLCMFDAARNMSRDKDNVFRDTPTFRWLRFLEYREATVDSIITQLALEGHRLPRCTSKVIKKIWFLMDFPDTKRRIGCIHNPELWSDADLFLACMFFMKLDMVCTHPVIGYGERRMRAMLLAQRTLTVLDKVLKRETMRNQYEMLRMFAEWDMDRTAALHGMIGDDEDEAPRILFGVRTKHLGRLRGEGWVANAPYLMRPDELVLKESIRRELRFQDKLIDMMLWGNTHPVTGADVFPRDWKGEVQTSFEDEVEKKVESDIALFASKDQMQSEDFDIDGELSPTLLLS